MPRNRQDARRQGGFTLLEVLVAFLIAALALGVLFNTALSGTATVRNAGLYDTALAIAQSRLAMAGRFVAGESVAEGEDGPFRWRVRVDRLADSGPAPAAPIALARQAGQVRAVLYRVTANVGWRSEGHGREVQLQTERLGFALPGGPGR